jgi:hypothetical protein
MTTEEAEAALQAWATVQRDELVQAAHRAGVNKNRIHAVTGIARTTIDRILDAPAGTPHHRITAYLEKFTGQWPRLGRPAPGQRTMASVYGAGQVADSLLADTEFRALRLGTWVSVTSVEVLASAVAALAPPLSDEDAELLTAALQAAAQRQQAEAQQKIAVGLLGGAALAIALGSSRGQGAVRGS